MKPSTNTILTFLFTLLTANPSGVSAQDQCISSAQALIPSCAQSCVVSAKSAIGCTVESDFACACRQPERMTKGNLALTGCILKACGGRNAPRSEISEGVKEVCGCATAVANAAKIVGEDVTLATPVRVEAAATTTWVAGSAAVTGSSFTA
ncbi:cfem domain-containing protein [Diplodia corticola]|uniref:Cfem domain-containing protein n=1 Tax=Diplodia corticola TaxID=236234 RepID=A0A1J9SCE5_9PEZI|nr:cfem domain-containing protein [Diplodia corticola]OJD37516.1 cfem domain-containing protein [Diplodia corticola]